MRRYVPGNHLVEQWYAVSELVKSILMSAQNIHSFISALLLVDAEPNAAVDRRALRDAGIARIRIMTSGVQAAMLLSGHDPQEPHYRPDVILCHKKLADMQGQKFVQLIRLHPLLLSMPVLMISNDNNDAARLDTLVSGSSGMLIRPYSQEELLKALNVLAGASEQCFKAAMQDLSTEAFDAALQRLGRITYDTGYGEQAFNKGLKALQLRRWDVAIIAFQRAMRQLTLKGESELGLAAAWQGKGDMVKYRYYLNEAGLTFARAERWHKARVTYTRLLRLDPEATSPFLTVAERHIRAEAFEEAATALAEGYDLGILDGLPDKLVQACMSTNDPSSSVEHMLQALTQTSIASVTESLGGGMREALAEIEGVAKLRSRLRAQNAQMDIVTDAFASSADTYDADMQGDGVDAMPVGGQAVPGEAQKGRAIAPLSEETTLPPGQKLDGAKFETTMFASIPILNEILTVIRVTWGLMRHMGKSP